MHPRTTTLTPAKVDKNVISQSPSNGQTSNGQTSNGQTSNGQTSNGQTFNGQTSNGQTSNDQVIRTMVATSPCHVGCNGRHNDHEIDHGLTPCSDHDNGGQNSLTVQGMDESRKKKRYQRRYKKEGLDHYTFIRDGDFDIVWVNCIVFVIAHLIHFYNHYFLFIQSDDIKNMYTWIYCYFVGAVGGLGITAGAHRLWSHKSYQATLPLRIFLMIGQCIAGQNNLYVWCRDHRVHHKFSESDGDPHNTNRGFFFAHCGWLLRKKHPHVISRAKTLDFSDLLADPVVKFQRDHYYLLYLFFAFLGPPLIPIIFWDESWTVSFLLVYVSRYLTTLHSTWFVNSTAHMFGDRPYNGNIQPRENYWVSFGSFGEGYHNYHHTFPWDYATAELGGKLNVTKMFIDTMAYLGLAFDLKKPSDSLIQKRKEKAKKLCLENKTV